MRILYLTQILSPSVGGGEQVFYNFAKTMSNFGHEIHVICHGKKPLGSDLGYAPSTDIRALEEMGVKIHNVNPKIEDRGGILLTYGQQIGYIINAYRAGNHLQKSSKIDIIHANMYSPVIAASMLGRIHHIPVVISVHNLILDSWKQWSSQKNVPRLTSIIGPLYEKIILKMPVDAVHVESNKVRSELAQFNPKASAFVIYNGVEPAEYLIENSKSEYRNFVLYLGRLVVRKNLEVLILAFKHVVKELPEAKLLIAGDGPMRHHWQELVNVSDLSRNVLYLGHISERAAKLELLHKCSAVVFPSVEEGFALVPIEAFAMSKPLLISHIKPSDEIVDDNVDGYLLPPDDPIKWSEKIIFMLKNPQVCETMGIRGRDKVLQTFNMSTVGIKMQHLYKSITSGAD